MKIWHQLKDVGDSLVTQSIENPTANAGDAGSIPEPGRSPGGGTGNPRQYSPEKSHGQRSLAGYSPWGLKESDTTVRLTLSLFFFSRNANHRPSISLHALHACSHSSFSQQLYE